MHHFASKGLNTHDGDGHTTSKLDMYWHCPIKGDTVLAEFMGQMPLYSTTAYFPLHLSYFATAY